LPKRPGTLQTLLRTAKREGWVQWIRSEADEHALLNGCRFSDKRAQFVVKFFETFLRHSTGEWAGKPFTLLDWQRDDLVMPLFGWLREDGTRRFRRGYCEVAKKNGKSAICSGIALVLLVADGEPRAEVCSAAADRDQAGLVFDESARMVHASPALEARCEVIPSRKRILYKPSWSTLQALSADVPTKEGLNLSGLIFDELHAQKYRNLYDTLRYAGRARRQPLMLGITTAGVDRKSICYEQRQYGERILDGSIHDDAFFVLIYAADEKKDDWKDPATWRKANPSMGVTIKEEDIASDCREAQLEPAKENSFKRYTLNLWTEQVTRWMPAETWTKPGNCRVVPIEDLRGHECWAGLDLASKVDIAALCLCFRRPADDVPLDGGQLTIGEDGSLELPENPVEAAYLFYWWFWAPEEGWRQREAKKGGDFGRWAKDGFITLTPGNVIDYGFIRKQINELGKDFSLQEIGFDPWNATQIATELGEDDGFQMVEMRQGYKTMSEPMKKLMALALEEQCIHGGNPIMKWMVSNVAARTDANENIAPDKEKSGDRIDGVVAAILALGRAMVAKSGTSVYEDRGIQTV